jgi:uncharacterized membrane protein
MKKRADSIRLVRVARAHMRLWLCIAVGLAIFAVVPGRWTSVLLGWDAGALCYLVAAGVLATRSSIADIRRHAAEQDEGAFGLLVLTVGAAVASLGAIFAELATTDPSQPGYAFHVTLVIATVALSWTFTHTIFALRYAHQFYGEGDHAGGLKFPGDERPDYWDFVYFAFVIGMTFQVSDVAVTSKHVRRLVLVHGMVAFVFTTAIIALTVNLAASAFASPSSP